MRSFIRPGICSGQLVVSMLKAWSQTKSHQCESQKFCYALLILSLKQGNPLDCITATVIPEQLVET